MGACSFQQSLNAAPGHGISGFAGEFASVDLQHMTDRAGRMVNLARCGEAGLQGDRTQHLPCRADPDQVDWKMHVHHPETMPAWIFELEPHAGLCCKLAATGQSALAFDLRVSAARLEGLLADPDL